MHLTTFPQTLLLCILFYAYVYINKTIALILGQK